ncbi:DNA polymerase III subunit gamma and tau [Phycicoccus sp.]|uniref:DNA polymerase III subunit gamma and tau n=1 Tax=Phycicoccus sp. TaxID=1902410 RepID=UPI002CF00401|nr:DNA polymerase III subunit gamma and tau [Phycicoccus sp.]HMM96232.1 DNA polymerase III subunit gamma and tau [Phycicoccus sp.]
MEVSTALYRRYRPETFADVIGQEHVTEPLMQALRTGRVGHAYLFSGPRGCGKTTSARILARCLNCEAGPTPEPCGTCDSCVALSRGGPGTVDVIEIDAASHGGVDDARDLRERASYGPAQSRYKIYIIDEAHMVTPQGFNALLKIVEEPPEHVKFVFATTEPEKVIGTIRSRTHHYPFRLVPPARLQSYMEELCAKEGVPVAPGVLSFVVRAGGGSVRDSLSVLDQLMAGSGEGGLTYESAAALLGFTDGELLDATVEAFAAGDAAAVFRAIDRVVETGLDPRRFVEDLLERLRDLIVVAAVQEGAAQVLRHVPEDQLERMRRQASAFGAGALSRAADVVNAGLTEMTGATAPRLQLELIAARILLPGAAGEAGYAARLDRLERRLEVGGVPTQAAASFAAPAAAPAAVSGPAATPAPSASTPAAAPVTPTPAPAPPVPVAPEPVAAQPDPGPEAVPVPDPVAESEPTPPLRATEPVPAAPAAAAPPKGPGGIDTDALRRSWGDVLDWLSRHKRVTWTFVAQNAQVAEYDGERVVLAISTSGLAETFRRGAHAEYVRQALIDVLGVDARVEGRPGDVAAAPLPEPPADADGGPAPAADGARPGPPGTSPSGPPSPDVGVAPIAPRADAPSWSDAPPPPETAPAWASPLEQARAAVAAESVDETAAAPHVVDDTAISDDDESIDDLADVGVPVVERILGGTVIHEEPR